MLNNVPFPKKSKSLNRLLTIFFLFGAIVLSTLFKSEAKNNFDSWYFDFVHSYKINFPNTWSVSDLSRNNQSPYTVKATLNNDFMVISVDKISNIVSNVKIESIYELDVSYLLNPMKNKFNDFELLKFEKTKLNGIDSYYLKYSFSLYSQNQNRYVNYISCSYYLINNSSNMVYILQGSANKNNVSVVEPIYQSTFSTFSFL
jgi:hypothetical protein